MSPGAIPSEMLSVAEWKISTMPSHIFIFRRPSLHILYFSSTTHIFSCDPHAFWDPHLFFGLLTHFYFSFPFPTKDLK